MPLAHSAVSFCRSSSLTVFHPCSLKFVRGYSDFRSGPEQSLLLPNGPTLPDRSISPIPADEGFNATLKVLRAGRGRGVGRATTRWTTTQEYWSQINENMGDTWAVCHTVFTPCSSTASGGFLASHLPYLDCCRQ